MPACSCENLRSTRRTSLKPGPEEALTNMLYTHIYIYRLIFIFIFIFLIELYINEYAYT